MRTKSTIHYPARAGWAAILTCILGLSGCGLLHRFHPSPSPYKAIDLATLPGGSTSRVIDINNNGQAVGRTNFAKSKHSHAVEWDPGQPPRDLGTLDGGGSEADRITDSGLVVGWSSDHTHVHAVEFGGAKPVDLGAVSGTVSLACGVDDAGGALVIANTPSGAIHSYRILGTTHTDLGTVDNYRDTTASAMTPGGVAVGTVDNGSGGRIAFTWANGRLQTLRPLSGFTDSYANGADSRGDVAGSCSDGPDRFRAVLWTNGVPSLLPGSTEKDSEAFAVNAAGQVVGQCNNHACLWQHGTIVDLNSVIGKHSNTVLNAAVAINDHGQIACNGMVNGTVNDKNHAFLLTPTHRT